eukprot:m.18503 g.18503  ORF g.18503 m.18503 type:complete len:635 (-) comp10094_c0_seq1:49-1953(-)
MENYRILKKLGKGAQGSVFLCEDKRNNEKYVLKKVECNDETEANKAFKEAMALEQLSHKYICGYKEFFVNWDKVEETMYVCIVMDYYETGDLENVLKQQRAKEKPMPEQLLKRWFGQMVEALAFVHGKKVIHRDLKPSNIFMTKDLDICIGDFGVATVMNDARTRTRTTVGTMNWMAPEVLERPYDERSDVWSLGCIILDAATCGFMDHAQSQSALFDIKHSSQRLEEVLKEVQKSYSKDFCLVIRAMLRRKFQQRPSAVDLSKLPFVRSCLELSHSELVADKGAGAADAGEKPTTTKRIPDTVAEVLDFLKANETRAGCQVMGMEKLRALIVAGDKSLPPAAKNTVLACMQAHTNNMHVQVAGCQVLRACVGTAAEEEELFSKKFIEPLLFAMRSHPAPDLQKEFCGLLWAMSAHEACAAEIGKMGGVQDVLSALRDNVDNEDIAQACCGALWSLSVCEYNAKIVAEEQGVPDVVAAMQSHSSSAALLEAACAALWTLSAEDEIVDLVFDLGCVGLMVKAMKDFIKESKLVKQAAIALASLVVDENCAYAVINNDEEVEGVSVILDAINTHMKYVDVIDNLTALVAELAEHDDLRELLVEKGATELLTKIKQLYPDREEIQEACSSAITLLAG